jgi:hypothetical protein
MKRLILPLVFILVAFGGVGMAVAGVLQFRNVTTGPVTRAKVDDCEIPTTGTVETCTGSWTVAGRRYSGKVDGAKIDDIDHTVKVRAHGNKAFEPSLSLPIILFVMGLFIAGAFVVLARATYTPRRDAAGA